MSGNVPSPMSKHVTSGPSVPGRRAPPTRPRAGELPRRARPGERHTRRPHVARRCLELPCVPPARCLRRLHVVDDLRADRCRCCSDAVDHALPSAVEIPDALESASWSCCTVARPVEHVGCIGVRRHPYEYVHQRRRVVGELTRRDPLVDRHTRSLGSVVPRQRGQQPCRRHLARGDSAPVRSIEPAPTGNGCGAPSTITAIERDGAPPGTGTPSSRNTAIASPVSYSACGPWLNRNP